MATNNKQFKVDFGFDAQATSNVVGDLGVTANVNVGNSFTTNSVASNLNPNTAGTLQLGNTTNRWVVFSNNITANGTLYVNGASQLVGIVNADANVQLSTTSTLKVGTQNTTANGVVVNTTFLTVGNTLVNSSITTNEMRTTSMYVNNQIVMAFVSTVHPTIAIDTANSTSNGFLANSSYTRVGNSTVNTYIASNGIFTTSNVTSNGVLRVSNSTFLDSVTVNGDITVIGDPRTVNLSSGATVLRIGNTATLGAPTFSVNSSFLAIGNASVITSIDSRTSPGGITTTGTLSVSGNTTLSGAVQTISGNSNFDSGVLFVDATNNRVGVNNTAPTVAFYVSGDANVSGAINAASHVVGTSFIANSTGAYHTGTINAASHTVGSSFIANSTGITHTGFTNVNSLRVGNSSSYVAANSSELAPSSNTIALGNTIGRFVITANTITTSGLITGGAGANIVGTANITASLYVGTQNSTSNGIAITNASITVGNTGTNTSITPTTVNTSIINVPLGSGTIVANTLGVYVGNATSQTVINANNVRLSTTGNLSIGVVNSTSNGLLMTGSSLFIGSEIPFGSYVAVGPTSISVSNVTSSFVANLTTVYTSASLGFTTAANTVGGQLSMTTNVFSYGNSSSNISLTSAGLVVGITGVIPVSNTTGTSLGNTTNRWVLNANSGNFSGNVTVTGAIVTTNAISANATTGTAGQVLKSGGAGANVYWDPSTLTLTDNTTSSSTFYPMIVNATSGSTATNYISSTKMSFVPSTGTLYAVVFSATSDENLKENIRSIEEPEKVLKLEGKHFNFIDDKVPASGFIAQQVRDYIPEAVSEQENGKLSVNYNPIIAYLLEVVKRQEERIKALESKQ